MNVGFKSEKNIIPIQFLFYSQIQSTCVYSKNEFEDATFIIFIVDFAFCF